MNEFATKEEMDDLEETAEHAIDWILQFIEPEEDAKDIIKFVNGKIKESANCKMIPMTDEQKFKLIRIIRNALRGDAKAQFIFGKMYLSESFVCWSQKHATYWIYLAAKQGYVKALYKLAYMYAHEDDMVQHDCFTLSSRITKYWCIKAIEAGSEEALDLYYEFRSGGLFI